METFRRVQAPKFRLCYRFVDAAAIRNGFAPKTLKLAGSAAAFAAAMALAEPGESAPPLLPCCSGSTPPSCCQQGNECLLGL
jgi:hypothetical protein